MADHGGGHGGGGHGGGHGSGGSSLDYKKLVGALVLVIIVIVVWKANFGGSSGYTQPRFNQVSQSERGQGPISRHNREREQWLSDCAANGAPVTNLGGGRMNCHRPATIRTYIDGVLQ